MSWGKRERERERKRGRERQEKEHSPGIALEVSLTAKEYIPRYSLLVQTKVHQVKAIIAHR